jgi:pimeloyl-ACP methyl ester carboxylesterase
MASQTEIIFVHGWGFDRACWDAWISLLDARLSQSFYDRGYFGSPNHLNQKETRASSRIVVAHSLGAHFLRNDMLAGADLLVLISCFAQFHAGNLDTTASKMITQAMRRKLSRSPSTVLSDFYERNGVPSVFVADASQLDIDLLLEDLDLLDEHTLDLDTLAKVPLKLVLHGAHDQINPLYNSHLLCQALPGAVLAVHPTGPHALPIKHPAWCIDRINEFAQIRSEIAARA